MNFCQPQNLVHPKFFLKFNFKVGIQTQLDKY